VALWARRAGVEWTDAARLEKLAAEAQIELTQDQRVLLNGEDVSAAIRTPEISEGASKVSAVSGVRRALVALQQRLGSEHSVVMEGRDIGTVVFPEAQVKIYLDASVEVRARRRVADFAAKGIIKDAGEVEAEIRDRDERDSTRPDSPLRQAPDAFLLDSSGLSEAEVEEEILRLVRARTSNGKEVQP